MHPPPWIDLNTVPTEAGGATAITFADGSVRRVQPELGLGFFFVSSMRHTGEVLHFGEKLILNQWVRFRPLPRLFYEGSQLLVGLERLSGVPPMALFARVEQAARRVDPNRSIGLGAVAVGELTTLCVCVCGVFVGLVIYLVTIAGGTLLRRMSRRKGVESEARELLLSRRT